MKSRKETATQVSSPNTSPNIPSTFADLDTARLLLRRYRPEDVEDVFAFAKDPLVARYVSWDTHQSIEDARLFVDRTIEWYADPLGKGWTWAIVLKELNKVIGSIGIFNLSVLHARCELGYVVGRDYWGQGYVTEAAQAVIEYCFNQLGLNRITAMCVPENTRSSRVMEKVGMTYEGTLRETMMFKGAYTDFALYAILRRDFGG